MSIVDGIILWATLASLSKMIFYVCKLNASYLNMSSPVSNEQ